MDLIANILIVLALGTVVVTLVLGMVQLGKREASARERSNILMRYRVITQAGAVAVLLLAFVMKSAS